MADGKWFKGCLAAVCMCFASGLLRGPAQFNIRMLVFNTKLGEREVSTREERQEGETVINRRSKTTANSGGIMGTLGLGKKQPCASLQAGATILETRFIIKDLEVFCSELS